MGRILYAERDARGQVVVKPRGEPLTDEERFKRVWVRRGVPRWRVDELWQQSLDAAARQDSGQR